MGKLLFRHREKKTPEAEELEKSLGETRLLIAQAYAGFNAVSDSDLVDAYVYEIQSLQARYSYLLRCRKALDGPLPARQSVPRPAAPRGTSPVLPVA